MATPDQEENNCKIVYEQDGVFIHTSSLHKDEDLLAAGKIIVAEKLHGVFLEWHAISQMEYSLEHGHGANDQEWAMVNTVGYKDGNVEIKGLPRHKFDINFNFDDLKCFKCFKPAQGWAHVIFILKEGITYPAVHFHCGGCPELIEVMEKYITINRSLKDPNLYLVVDENVSALEKAFNDLQLFKETSTDFVSRLYIDPYTTAMNSFSKVTNLLFNSFTPSEHASSRLEILPPTLTEKDVAQHIDPDFVLISEMKLGPRPGVQRSSPLTREQWDSAMDSEGRIIDFSNIKKCIFKGGITHNLRPEVWKFLLHYHNPLLTCKSRKEEQKKKTDDYFRMKLQWKSMTLDQLSRFSELYEKTSLIDKDIRRTDRTHPFFKGDDNQSLVLMKDILTTYCMYNFDLGYVQGMSDILSPLLVVMEDEVDSFWCFVGFMDRIGQNFKMDQEAMKRQFFELRTILHYVNSDLSDYLENHESGHLTFCFPWILILFKREFSFPDIMKLWEVFWTDLPCKNFHLLICAVILEAEQITIMENNFGLTEIVKHINDISQTIDLEDVLRKAEGLFLQLKDCPELPSNLQKMLLIGPCA